MTTTAQPWVTSPWKSEDPVDPKDPQSQPGPQIPDPASPAIPGPPQTPMPSGGPNQSMPGPQINNGGAYNTGTVGNLPYQNPGIGAPAGSLPPITTGPSGGGPPETVPSETEAPTPAPAFDRQAFLNDKWALGSHITPQQLQGLVSKYASSGVKLGGRNGDKVWIPNDSSAGGEWMDVGSNWNPQTGGGNSWSGVGGAGGNGAPSYTPGGTFFGGIGGTGGMGAGGSFSSYSGGGNASNINDAIMRLLGRGEAPLDANDPSISQQYLPIRNALERRAQMTRGAAAERRAASGQLFGGGGGALDSDIGSINENLGQQEGQALGGVIGNELQARRQDVVNALQFAQGEEKMALTYQLQMLDNELRRRSLDQQNQQYYDELGFKIGDREQTANERLLQLLYGQ